MLTRQFADFFILNHGEIIIGYICKLNKNLTLTPTLSTVESVQ